MRLLVSLGLVVAMNAPASAACPITVPATCDTLPGPIVYLQVGDTQLNLMKALGRQLRDNASKPITLVWITSGSCANIDLMYHGNPPAGITATMSYVPSTAEDASWQPTSALCTCTPPAGLMPDIGNSALFNSACVGTEAPPSTIHLTIGPTQAYVMAMPRGSDTTAITAEEAYFVFGFGPTLLASMSAAIAPWTDEAQLWIRTNTKSTLLAWAANIGVPATKWHGTKLDGSPMVVSALQTSTNPGAAIGILGVEVYDGLRATLQSLAFRTYGQYAAYFPDSTSSSHDKKNVRDGHYTVWSPTIWMDRVNGTTGLPTNDTARYVVDLIAGHPVTPAPSFNANVVVANVGLVPNCAMRVSRTQEGGPLSLYKPPASCTCQYENAVDTTSCTPCTTTCATGVCRDGFCEEF